MKTTDSDGKEDLSTVPSYGSYSVPCDDYEARRSKYTTAELINICRTLSRGDEIIVNDRANSLWVRLVEDCSDRKPIQVGNYLISFGPDDFCVHLHGNGIRYEIHYSPDDTFPYLVYPSGDEPLKYVDIVKDGEVYEPAIRMSVTGDDVLGDYYR